MAFVCPICSGPVTKKHDKGPAPLYCSKPCRQRASRRTRNLRQARNAADALIAAGWQPPA